MFQVTDTTVKLPKTARQLPVLLVDIPSSKSVTTMFLANTGSRYESKAEEGLAHFFEHMVFKGTKRFATAQALAETLDSVGADFNAFTSKEYTGYYVRSAVDHFALALDVLSDMLFSPKLNQTDIEREKGVIIEEINMYKDNPSAHIANVFEEMVFAKAEMAHPIIGHKANIQSFAQINFQNFLQKYYGPENLLLVIAGGLKSLAQSEQQILSQIKKALAKFQGDRVAEKQQAPRPQSTDLAQMAQNSLSRDKFKLVKRPTEQAHFVMAWPSLPADHEDRYALQVLSAIVGGNMSSRLFSKVREELGLAYYVNSDLDFFHDIGLFGCSAGVDQSRAEEAIRASKGVFTELLDSKAKISASELQRAKDYLRGKTWLGLENSNSVAQFFGLRKLLRGQIMSIDSVMAKIDAVSLADLERVAAAVIRPSELRLAIIGNFKNEEKLRQAMS
jgi:predicted Zn-dependent peptidase